jgi:transcriptional repressor NrdR
MRCPFCRSDATSVVDSRLAEEGDAVRRRRRCHGCGARYTTIERPQLRMPLVIKSDGKREPFQESKLRGGIGRALEKRPVDSGAVESALHRIQRKLLTLGEREVRARQIGEWVMQELSELDQVAYVRFASVYRSFQDVSEFNREIARLRGRPAAAGRKRAASPARTR